MNVSVPVLNKAVVHSFTSSFVSLQMMLPLTHILNSLHSLKNTATASVQTLHREFVQEQSSILKEVSHAQK